MLEKFHIHYGYVIVLCCCLIMGVNVGIAISCAGIFYKPVSISLNVSVGKLGLYASAIYMASAIMLPFAGKLTEKFGSRIMLTVNSAIMGVCYLSMAQFNSVWQFYLAGGVIGITLAFLLYLSFPTLINSWFQTRVGFFIGVCSAASGIGGIIFNPFGAWLITEYGWRIAFGVFGLIILFVITPILGLLIKNNPQDIGTQPVSNDNKKPTDTVATGNRICKSGKNASFLRFDFLRFCYGCRFNT